MAGRVDVAAGMVRLRTKTSADSLCDAYHTPQKRKQVPTRSSQGSGSCPASTSSERFFGNHYYFKISHIFNHVMELGSSKILQHRLLENFVYNLFVYIYIYGISSASPLRLPRSFSTVSVPCLELNVLKLLAVKFQWHNQNVEMRVASLMFF